MNIAEKNHNKSINAARLKISEWHMEHRDDYAAFLKDIENADNGNFDVYIKIFKMAVEFIPLPVIWELENVLSKKNDKANNETTIQQRQVFEETYAEVASWEGYLRIGIEDGELDVNVVPEKDEDDKTHYYLLIKTGEELWNGLPLLLRMGIQMFLHKSAKELGEHFKRIITAFVLTAGDMYESMQERMKEDTDNSLLHCVLYYISMDGGLVRSAKHLSKLLHSARGISQMMMFVPLVIGKMTEVSVKHGHDKQSDWKELTHNEDEEVSKEVKHALVDTKGLRGRRVINTTKFNIDDMLIGDKEKIKEQIGKFRKTYKCTTHLSFLLIILVRAECVDKFISYPHFHHAMEELEGKKYDMDRVSRMYNYMFYHKEDFEKSELPKWCNGRMIIRNWQKSFEKCKS